MSYRRAHPDLSRRNPKVFQPVPGYDLLPEVPNERYQTRATLDELFKDNEKPKKSFAFQKMRV